MTACGKFRDWVPRALLDDLGAAEKSELERHLADCSPCRTEQELYRTTLGHLKASPNLVPRRHFFVYEEQARRSPWISFREMSLGWQAGLAAAAVLLCVLAASAAADLQIRSDGGALTIGFGNLPARPVITPPPAVDVRALEARILKAAEEKNRRETLQWVRTLRSEAAASSRKFTPQQRLVLQNALAELQAGMEANLEAAVTTVRAGNDKSVADLYQVVSARRQTDLTDIEKRINSLAANGEMKNNQTDAILETLLQVAELKIK